MWGWKGRSADHDFPKGFRCQRIGVQSAIAIADLPPEQIAAHFREDSETAKRLLAESYDKRYSPSTYISEESDGFSVGWISKRYGRQCERRFSNLEDAATDYLLFSLGKGRWRQRRDQTVDSN